MAKSFFHVAAVRRRRSKEIQNFSNWEKTGKEEQNENGRGETVSRPLWSWEEKKSRSCKKFSIGGTATGRGKRV